MKYVTLIGMIASVVLPLWNIPLIVRVVRRRSSADISTAWAYGVWGSMLGMIPAGLLSEDIVFKAFTVVNFLFFSGVVIAVAVYRNGPGLPNEKPPQQ